MRSGTTPKLEITLDIPINTIQELWVTFSTKGGTEVLTKTFADCTTSEDKLIVSLSQAETLLLNPCCYSDSKVLVQVRVLTNDNEAYASPIHEIYVERTLKEGVISNGN